jgi:hypothetical protein
LTALSRVTTHWLASSSNKKERSGATCPGAQRAKLVKHYKPGRANHVIGIVERLDLSMAHPPICGKNPAIVKSTPKRPAFGTVFLNVSILDNNDGHIGQYRTFERE